MERYSSYDNVLDLIGWTPLVKLSRVSSYFNLGGNELYAKLEMFNPGGSVKDRIAVYMLRKAEEERLIAKGAVIIEPTSGNTGIGLALASIVLGYNLVVTMPTKMSTEKELMLKALGAYVIRTPTEVSPDHPLSYYRAAEALRNLVWAKARRISKRELEEMVSYLQRVVNSRDTEEMERILSLDPAPTPYAYIPNQYYNKYNPLAHYETTAREIWIQTGGNVDYIFAGMGTGGTITGIARFFKAVKGDVKIVGVDPEGSIYHLVKKGMDPSEAQKHARTYKVEGIGEDFLPATIDLSLVDDVVVVGDQEAFSMARLLARLEGILAGGSSGAVLYAAVRYVKEHSIRDSRIVVILPDTGRNYLTKFYNDEWMLSNGFNINDEEVLGDIA